MTSAKNFDGTYAHESDVNEGTALRADGGFDCMKQGEIKTVKIDDNGHLYVSCRQGKHLLDGQINDDGYYVGLYIAKEDK